MQEFIQLAASEDLAGIISRYTENRRITHASNRAARVSTLHR
jgi:hypothetical protein